ncbi:DUF551 domain-containing protein [Yersinia ruckeri]|nr:DUF551 domain-containing protein [Yersinia ruckeri]
MKELDSFTVERLEELARGEKSLGLAMANYEESKLLAAIALAAKRAEPVAWTSQRSLDTKNKIVAFTDDMSALDYGTANGWADIVELYTTPQLNSPQGWIKCSDQMPENSNIQCFVYCKDSLRRTGYFDGNDWAINGKYYDESFVTHWQKFPAAPESPL